MQAGLLGDMNILILKLISQTINNVSNGSGTNMCYCGQFVLCEFGHLYNQVTDLSFLDAKHLYR